MTERKYRILCIGETWIGSDARAAFMAFRRLGHFVQIINESAFVPIDWKGFASRAIRKLFRPVLVNELTKEAVATLRHFRPHCLFVFKGSFVHPQVIAECRNTGTLAVNFYPDVSFRVHGRYIPRALPLYDHVFNTKSYGLGDMRAQLGIRAVTFLEHGFDPELHRPVEVSEEDRAAYGSDVAFIGTWSPKKEILLSQLRALLPTERMRIWGTQWEKSRSANLSDCVAGYGITGEEYTRAICATSVCLGLLSEIRAGASSGDLITARTFQIPACGTLMAHERNAEALRYFEDGKEALFFDSVNELAEKINYFLADRDARVRVARAGLDRSLHSGYAIDHRMENVIRWLDEHYKSPSPKLGVMADPKSLRANEL